SLPLSPAAQSLESEIELVFRLVHILLEVFFPDARPRPVEHVRNLERNDLSRRDLRRVAIDRVQAARAFRPTEALGRAPAFLIVAEPQDPYWLHEGFGIVDHGFPVDAEELATRVVHGSHDLDGLERVAELPRGVLCPRLNVG